MKFVQLTKEYLSLNVEAFINLVDDWKYCTWKKENFLYELPKKWDLSFAIYEENNLEGFCFASNKIIDVYYIHLIFVSDKSRGKSFGKKMIERAIELAKQNNLPRIELRCPESNTGALDFYKKKGFKTVSLLKDAVSGPEADYYLALEIKK
jgi:ribosomal protein S18 acetylase RimI-like enzyme